MYCFSSVTDSLYHLPSHSKKRMVLVANSPLSLVQDQVHEVFLVGTSSFLHSFNVIPCIYISCDVKQGPLSNEENIYIPEHKAAKCTGFDNCRFLDDFLLSLTLLSLNFGFNIDNCAGFQFEPSLGPPNENQDSLCSTIDFSPNKLFQGTLQKPILVLAFLRFLRISSLLFLTHHHL